MKKILICLLLLAYKSDAQTGFTASDFEKFISYDYSQLDYELKHRLYHIERKNVLPNEIQYRYEANGDPNKILVAIYIDNRLKIIDYVTNENEQNKFKNSLSSAKFTYKSTKQADGFPLVKYIKDGGLSGGGLEVDFGANMFKNRKQYSIFFWNWRKQGSKINTANSPKSNSILPSKNLDGNYMSGSHILRIKNGKVAICLIGQLYINTIVKDAGNKRYELFFVNEDKSQYSAGTNWNDYSKVQSIADLFLINSRGDIRMEWSGLWNKETFEWEYDTLDDDPNTKLIFKKGD